jgi:hypothetical protein
MRAGSGGWNEVKDAGTILALNETIVAPDLVEHLRAEPDVALRAVAFTSFRQSQALAVFGELLERGERIRWK